MFTLQEIDLRKLEGSGDFPCPECGTILSPEDETEQTYKIQEAIIKNEKLTALILECKCGTKIRLSGFEVE